MYDNKYLFLFIRLRPKSYIIRLCSIRKHDRGKSFNSLSLYGFHAILKISVLSVDDLDGEEIVQIRYS